MKRFILFAALSTACAWSIGIPRVGYTRDAQGLVRAVDGIAGNFLVGDPIDARAALAFAWNGNFGIRKTDASIEWLDSTGGLAGSIDAPAGGAVLGFDRAGGSAWVFFEESQTLYTVSTIQSIIHLSEVPLSLATNEEVMALAGNLDSVDIALRRGDGIYVATFDRSSGSRLGEVALTRSASRVLLLTDGSIAGIDGSTLWLLRLDGSDWSIDTGVGLLSLSPMASNWIQAGPFALRTGAEPRLYQIPEAVQ